MKDGCLERYLKKAKKAYREKYNLARGLAEQHIPCRQILGEGGTHLFIQLNGIPARGLLEKCLKAGVSFMPGDIFYTDGGGWDTLRLGLSRVSPTEIEKGIRIIGRIIKEWESK